jgi:acylphosphatase
MQRRAVQLTIRGRVQGVGYRWWALRAARRLGLDGWVRNRFDGSVEILAIGPDAAIEALIAACRKGPDAATVSSIEQVEAEDDGAAGFDEMPTA